MSAPWKILPIVHQIHSQLPVATLVPLPQPKLLSVGKLLALSALQPRSFLSLDLGSSY